MTTSQTHCRPNRRPDEDSYLDLDSHADTCVLGNNALLVEKPHPVQTSNASFADPALGSVTKPMLSGAFKYTSPATGKSYIFVVHQAIYIETMTHSLLCPMQMRENDVILNECPKSVTENPTEDHHSVTVTADTADQQLRVPLRLCLLGERFP